jgi:hypothetical protein
MADAEPIEDACPVCGAMLAEAPLADPERAQSGREDNVEPLEDVDYRERKPSYEAGVRPPAPDAA